MDHPRITWTFDPALLASLVLITIAYVTRFRAARREASGRGASWPQALAFAGFLVAMLGARISPVDSLGEDYLFSAHMVQHILLGDIAPLLLLLSLSRVIMRPLTRRMVNVEKALGPLARPGAFLVVWFVLVYFWHIPAMYDAALGSPGLHALEHASFFTAGICVWWPLIQPIPMRNRLEGLKTFAYIFTAKIGLGILGLYLVWSKSVAYPYYEGVPRIWGLSALDDQNVGGSIMMVEQSILLALVLVVLFVKMINQSEEDELRRERLEDAAPA